MDAQLRLFIYGTLLQGEPQHALLEGATPLGAARTTPTYGFLDLGPYPALVEGGATSVRGEVYHVTTEVLERLDDYEGHPELYRRALVTLESAPHAEAYLLDDPGERARGTPIASGDWRAHVTDRKR